MKIYQLRAIPDEYDSLNLIRRDDYPLDRGFDGSPRSPNWQEIEMRYYTELEKIKRTKGDFPCFLTVPVFSTRAVDALGDLLQPNGELLPVKVSGDKYFMFNVTNLIDALDGSLSTIEYFPSSERVMAIDKYVFTEYKLTNASIFKIVERPKSFPYCSQEFVDRVNDTGLKGFRFIEVYNSSS